MEIGELYAGPLDTLRNMSADIYKEAYKNKRSLSAHLNALHPEKDFNDGLDGFQRLLMLADINPSTDIENGEWSDPFSKFLETDSTRALVPEFCARKWRQVAAPNKRAIYLSGDQVDGSIARPYADTPGARWDTNLAPAIPLSEVEAMTTPVDGDAYRAFYMTSSVTATRMYRVAEGATIPRAKMVGGQRTVRLVKFGRAIELTYEAMRRMRIDMVSLHVQRMAVQAEIDKVAWALDTIINGDGNSGTAATVHNLTTLDAAAVAGTLTLKGWLRFRMQFANPYYPTTALANEAVVLQMMLLNVGSANQPLMSLPAGTFGGLQPINPGLASGMRVGWTSDAPALKIVAFDKRITVNHLVEVGADISEVESFIGKQTKLITLTEVEGFQILDGNGARILDINA